jgi:hypothetical protein|tara:strand:+ start:348 stop:629 length:282 start_codon:yes stop_codon:yes gene_type:complete
VFGARTAIVQSLAIEVELASCVASGKRPVLEDRSVDETAWLLPADQMPNAAGYGLDLAGERLFSFWIVTSQATTIYGRKDGTPQEQSNRARGH